AASGPPLSLDVEPSHTKHRTSGTRQTRSRRQLNLVAHPERLGTWFHQGTRIQNRECRTHSQGVCRCCLSVVVVFVRAVILAYFRLTSGAHAQHLVLVYVAWVPGSSHSSFAVATFSKTGVIIRPWLRIRIWSTNSSGVLIWLAAIHFLKSSTSSS